jgi:uncharacterized protein (DUF4415 family)
MSASKRDIRSDLAKVDAHVLTEADYNEIPELTDEDFERAVRSVGGKLAPRRGRPKSDQRKQLLSLRLDPDVIEAYRATGPGWQTRMQEVLRTYAPGRAEGAEESGARLRRPAHG